MNHNQNEPAAAGSTQAFGPFAPAIEYTVDAAQRAVLFWDVMRQRGNQYHEHMARLAPHVLSYQGEIVIDGRTLERPVNYALARVIPPKGVEIDPRRRPFIVVDPRAGHGPGIGGFKADSEIGVAFKAGHPCYFVGFLPDPVPGQTLEDIARAEAVFIEKVIALHPEAEAKPCVIGNCQAGWAVMMLAAMRPELFGPIIIAGSPLSDRAVCTAKIRCATRAGLLGGSWLTALTSDLGRGGSMAPGGGELRERDPPDAVDQAVQPVRLCRYRGWRHPRLRTLAGGHVILKRRGNRGDSLIPVHRQESRGGNVQSQGSGRHDDPPAQHPFAQIVRVLLQRRQRHAAAAGIGCASICTTMSTTSADTARRSSTPCYLHDSVGHLAKSSWRPAWLARSMPSSPTTLT